MSDDGDRQRWNGEYAAGRWDFLSCAVEHTRLSLAAGMVRCDPRRDVVDLGCGPGHLLDWLPAPRAASYLAVDISDAALERLRERWPGARTVRAALSEFQPPTPVAGALVASEVLTYADDSVSQLARIVDAYEHVDQVIVCVLGPHPERPNWGRGSERVWRALSALPWTPVQRASLTNERTGVSWKLVDFDPGKGGKGVEGKGVEAVMFPGT